MPPGDSQSSNYNPVAAAGISGGAGVLGGIFSSISNAVENQKNREFYMQNMLFNKMYDATINEMERVYNLPKNQVQRLIDAGINPNLMAGSPSNTQNFAQSSFNNPPAANPVQWGSALQGVNQAIQQYLNVTAMNKSMEMQDAQIAELRSREQLNMMRSFRELVFGQDKQYDLQGKQSISYWELFGQKQQEQIQDLITKNAIGLLKYMFQMETFDTGVELEKGKVGEQKAKINYYNSIAEYQDAHAEESRSNKTYVDTKNTKLEMENQWNAMTQTQRLALLNAAVEIAKVNEKYAGIEKAIETIGGIENLMLKPFEVISDFFPSNLIGQLLGLGGKSKKTK